MQYEIRSIVAGVRRGSNGRALIDTSYRWNYEGVVTFETGETPHVVDVDRAVRHLLNLHS